MIEINKNPSKGELRWFGVLFVFFFGLIGALIWWRFDAPTVAKVLWVIGIAYAVIYYAVPALQKRMLLGWVYLTYPIGFVISHLLMGITYYLVFTPTGLLLRLFGRDSMQKKFDRSAATYWIERKPITDSSRYFKQF